jgi:hypothetical protein
MANGLLSDWMSGTGVYGSPTAIDPQTGVPYADTRAAQLGALGNIGSLLIAAGQPMTGAQRAQLLGQIGPQISGMQTDIYNAAQRRLMQAQFADQMSARSARDKLYQEAQADPAAFEKKFGFSPVGLPADSLLSLTTKMAESNALAKPEREALKSILGGELSSTTVTPEMALAGGEGPTVGNAAKVGTTVPPDMYKTLVDAGNRAVKSGTPTGLGIAKTMFDLADKVKPNLQTVAPGATVIDASGKTIYTAPEREPTTEQIKNYNFMKSQLEAAGLPVPSFADYAKEQKAGQTINIDTQSQKGANAKAQELAVSRVEAAEMAVEDMNTINEIRRRLDQGAITGFGAGGILKLGQAAGAVGLTDPNDPRLVNTSANFTALARRTLDGLQAVKGTASEKDAAIVARAAGADSDLSEAEMRVVFDVAERLNKRIIAKGKKASESIKTNKYESIWDISEPEPYKQVNIQRTVPDPTNPSKNIAVRATLGEDGNYYTVLNGQKFRIEE